MVVWPHDVDYLSSFLTNVTHYYCNICHLIWLIRHRTSLTAKITSCYMFH